MSTENENTSGIVEKPQVEKVAKGEELPEVDAFTERCRSAAAMVRSDNAVVQLWEMFTSTERDRVGGNLERARAMGIPMMLATATGKSVERAVYEAQMKLGYYTPADANKIERMLRRKERLMHETTTQRLMLASNQTIDDLIDGYARVHDAVVVRGTGVRRLFWLREEIVYGWNAEPAVWELLMALVSAAQHGLGVGPANFDGVDLSFHALASRRNRLKKTIPANFDRHVIIERGTGTYRLNLQVSELVIVDLETQMITGPFRRRA
jgi:hypothetical protein